MEGSHYFSTMKEEHNTFATMNHTNSLRSTHQIFAFSSSSSSSQTNNSSLSVVLSAREDHHHHHVNEANSNRSNEFDRKDCGRERLKKHREEVAGQVLVPETWGQEGFLKDWIDCSSFDKSLAPDAIASARKSLVAAASTSHHQLRIGSRC